MLSYFKTVDGRVRSTAGWEPGCWINCVAPSEDEIAGLIRDFSIEPDFFRAAMDEEESSHIDSEDGNTLIIIDIPVVTHRERDRIRHDAARHHSDGEECDHGIHARKSHP